MTYLSVANRPKPKYHHSLFPSITPHFRRTLGTYRWLLTNTHTLAHHSKGYIPPIANTQANHSTRRDMGDPPDIFCSPVSSPTPMSDVEIVFCYLAALPYPTLSYPTVRFVLFFPTQGPGSETSQGRPPRTICALLRLRTAFVLPCRTKPCCTSKLAAPAYFRSRILFRPPASGVRP
ncbi:hypothetical protein LY78DRAFT_481520 [Colletotrichum sublineola]|nr:hypothetical protein LY78DRAFT_481520 [Colletotrichum sublineola]